MGEKASLSGIARHDPQTSASSLCGGLAGTPVGYVTRQILSEDVHKLKKRREKVGILSFAKMYHVTVPDRFKTPGVFLVFGFFFAVWSYRRHPGT